MRAFGGPGFQAGRGARFDAPTAPAGDLLLARRGAAFFARELNALSDAQLDLPSRTPGRNRAWVVAQVSHQARGMAIAMGGLGKRLTRQEAEWRPDVEGAATLPRHALRHLYAHSEVHLNVAFRDLTDAAWLANLSIAGADAVPVAALPMERARAIWRAGQALGAGGLLADIPLAVRSYPGAG